MARSKLIKFWVDGDTPPPPGEGYFTSPTTYRRTYQFRAAVHDLADGSAAIDAVTSQPKRVWTLGWQWENVSVLNALRTLMSRQMQERKHLKFMDVNGVTYNVIMMPIIEQDSPAGFEDLIWSFSVTLKEI
ncbi:MAG: hypothetical protein ACUVS5_08615 [Anaerolineae bacterium]